MKTANRFAALMTISLFSLIALSCSGQTEGEPPYLLGTPIVTNDPKQGDFQYGGVLFTLYNAADKDIEELRVSCLLYLADGTPLSLKNGNAVQAKLTGLIGAKQTASLQISLDDRVYAALPNGVRADYFCAYRIAYADGSSWEDPSLAFFVRGE
jgi:hypothetical protein